ncbi:electron transport complex subunit RsxB [Paraburkholderia sp. SARCC-3016]|uniref:electron transport complex subunit RsxB n=1 Tax=Paraburkholderia sp. SARCC-3016 TaxID=3058611 RepID=UPI0028074C48|nr:electron transport complex subunit RsxB [Paraburkholderia sp. SARCC-3016]MDQ7979323.1 electron transport complex subunit RsxB [Paraburkholderia sp. SARCC-3016]
MAAASPDHVTVTDSKTLADRIEDLLPQTQCTKCGYHGCRPYAQAIADGSANYNQCPPGGAQGIARLAALLGKPVIPLNPDNGIERPRPVAFIDENLCIGCTLCMQACPVDAIVGAARQMHTIVAELCTGCDLCVPPCPVDCIAMIPVTGDATGWDAWSQPQADAARERYHRRLARLDREREAAEARAAARRSAAGSAAAGAASSGAGNAAGATPGDVHAAPASAPPRETGAASPAANADANAKKRAVIEAALERARKKKEEMQAKGQGPQNTANVSAQVQAQIDAAEARRRRLGIEDETGAPRNDNASDAEAPRIDADHRDNGTNPAPDHSNPKR